MLEMGRWHAMKHVSFNVSTALVPAHPLSPASVNLAGQGKKNVLVAWKWQTTEN